MHKTLRVKITQKNFDDALSFVQKGDSLNVAMSRAGFSSGFRNSKPIMDHPSYKKVHAAYKERLDADKETIRRHKSGEKGFTWQKQNLSLG